MASATSWGLAALLEGVEPASRLADREGHLGRHLSFDETRSYRVDGPTERFHQAAVDLTMPMTPPLDAP